MQNQPFSTVLKTSTLKLRLRRNVLPLLYSFSESFKDFGVLSRMVRPVGELKIFKSVIRLNSVKVVNYFAHEKISANVFFHYQSVLRKIIMKITEWVFRKFNINIATTDNSSPLPRWVESAQFSFISSNTTTSKLSLADTFTMFFSSLIDSRGHSVILT